MKNFIQPGETVTFAAPYDRLSGQGALIGTIFGVAQEDVLNTVRAPFCIEGVFELAKADSQAWTEGAKIYWDDTNKVCTTPAMSLSLIHISEPTRQAEISY